ncbi:MAG: hypothetical protein A2396_02985 [Candidatus Levybacteria bacterium RIFOXYB1_FULL_40_17]|nr:MAG: hypothetical protein A2396_02985 [Candidatus Levybacteria bacterium RIFOXYB1_FULL_40_17]
MKLWQFAPQFLTSRQIVRFSFVYKLPVPLLDLNSHPINGLILFQFLFGSRQAFVIPFQNLPDLLIRLPPSTFQNMAPNLGASRNHPQLFLVVAQFHLREHIFANKVSAF